MAHFICMGVSSVNEFPDGPRACMDARFRDYTTAGPVMGTEVIGPKAVTMLCLSSLPIGNIAAM